MSEQGTSVSKSEKLESARDDNDEEDDEELERMMLEEDDESSEEVQIKAQSDMSQDKIQRNLDLAQSVVEEKPKMNLLPSDNQMVEETINHNDKMDEEKPEAYKFAGFSIPKEKQIGESMQAEDESIVQEGALSNEASPLKQVKRPIPMRSSNPIVNLTLLQDLTSQPQDHQHASKEEVLASNLLKGLTSTKESNSFETPLKGELAKGNHNGFSAPEINSTACKTTFSKQMANSLGSTLEKGSVIQKELSSKKEKVEKDLMESMMTEEKPKYAEEQLDRKMRALRSKMSIADAEESLEALQTDPATNQKEINAILEGMKGAKAWKARYQELMQKQNRSASKMRDLADELEHVFIRIDEMEVFLESYLKHRSWKTKLSNASRILKKPKASQIMDLEENTLGNYRITLKCLIFQNSMK